MVYEIWTNHGLLRIGHDKETNNIFQVDESVKCEENFNVHEFSSNKREEIFIPTLK